MKKQDVPNWPHWEVTGRFLFDILIAKEILNKIDLYKMLAIFGCFPSFNSSSKKIISFEVGDLEIISAVIFELSFWR